MAKPGRAIVIGGSLAGLCAALLLRRIGWEVRVYERSDVALAGRGAGIVTHPALFAALARAGVTVDATIGVEVPGRRTFDRPGRIVGERSLRQVLTSWDRIYRLLAQHLPRESYRLGMEVTRVATHDGDAVVELAGGARERADLLIAADGIRSTVRAQLLPEAKPLYCGYIAWRGLADEALLDPRTHDELFGWFAFCLPSGEQMLGYPVAGPDNDLRLGRRRYNFVWYRPADEVALARMLVAADGQQHILSIPPHQIRPELIDGMRADADALLAPQFAEVVGKTDAPFFQPIYDVESPRMAVGRIALIGDAAFVARPHVGMGVTKAAEDAAALADALVAADHDVEPALARFEAARHPVGARVVARARHLGAYMQAQVRTPEERAHAERFRTPEAVMAETAVADFLPA